MDIYVIEIIEIEIIKKYLYLLYIHKIFLSTFCVLMLSGKDVFVQPWPKVYFFHLSEN